MKILLIGRDGQLGSALLETLAPLGEVAATGRKALDLSQADSIRAKLRQVKPDVIVNAAAYTAVDRAESERDAAFAVNAMAPGVLAEQAKRLDSLLVHFSTDCVFDGRKQGAYVEEDAPNPVSAYGESKLAGERAVIASGCRHLIFRTSWVYSARGSNFVLQILRAAREKPELRVVDDQRGAPTSARDLAAATATVLGKHDAPSGLYHMTSAGATSRHDFAREILKLAGVAAPLRAVPSSDYPTPAQRPKNSVLDNAKLKAAFGVSLPHWRSSLGPCVGRILEHGA